mmetsp:Transcript_23075/g.52458  ORF Transcript_23075/g.52458 Transcript_23075/m.52458 type:complete len:228 (+) Transcript_23075:231-914(+)
MVSEPVRNDDSIGVNLHHEVVLQSKSLRHQGIPGVHEQLRVPSSAVFRLAHRRALEDHRVYLSDALAGAAANGPVLIAQYREAVAREDACAVGELGPHDVSFVFPPAGDGPTEKWRVGLPRYHARLRTYSLVVNVCRAIPKMHLELLERTELGQGREGVRVLGVQLIRKPSDLVEAFCASPRRLAWATLPTSSRVGSAALVADRTEALVVQIILHLFERRPHIQAIE